MKATEIIERDHRAAEALFETYKNAATGEERAEIEKDIFKALTRHELMEDRYFYPALKDAAGEDTDIKELDHEQTELEAETMAIQAMEVLTGDREERITKMMEKVLAHAKKEESIIFPKAEELLGEEKLNELGADMEPHSAVAKADGPE